MSTQVNNLHEAEKVPEGLRLHDILYHCLRQNFHADCANAAVHCAEVRFSPITFRIAEYLWNHFPSLRGRPEVLGVIEHSGAYAEDPGR